MSRVRHPRGPKRGDDKPACFYWPRPVGPVDNDPEALMEWQRGRCGLCGVGSERTFDTLKLDHDHDTAFIRGYLCGSCNRLEAHSDHPAYVAWREGIHPAAILGVEDIYWSSWHGYAVPSIIESEMFGQLDHRASDSVGEIMRQALSGRT